jgi:hypothetical protein
MSFGVKGLSNCRPEIAEGFQKVRVFKIEDMAVEYSRFSLHRFLWHDIKIMLQ